MPLISWLRDLPPDFAFLLSLSFIVAAAAFVGDWWRRHRARSGAGKTPRL